MIKYFSLKNELTLLLFHDNFTSMFVPFSFFFCFFYLFIYFFAQVFLINDKRSA